MSSMAIDKSGFNKRASILAEDYWRLKGRLISGEMDQKRNELEEIDMLLEKGISGKLGMELEARASELRTAMGHGEDASMGITQIRRDLLELMSVSAPSFDSLNSGVYSYDQAGGALSEEYFMAVTDILFGESRPKIGFSRAVISEKGVELKDTSISDLGALRILNYITTIVQESAKKMLGKGNLLDSAWNKLKQREYAFIAFNVLVESDKSLTLEEIKEISDLKDEEYKGLMEDIYNKRLEEGINYLNSSDEWVYPMVGIGGGSYYITDFGRWVWMLCRVHPVGESSMDMEEEIGPSAVSKIYQKMIKSVRGHQT